MSVARISRRLQELDAERADLLTALKVFQRFDPGAKTDGEKLVARALAHVNGNGNGHHPAAGGGGRRKTMPLVIEFLQHAPRRPHTASEVRDALGGAVPIERVIGALTGLTKKTRQHPKLVKRQGKLWIFLDKAVKGAKPKGAKPSTPGGLKAAILGVLREHNEPVTFQKIRNTLRVRGAIGADSTAGRGVSVVLHTALTKKGLVKLSKDGWSLTDAGASA
jgi:hypothetical protein